jgi:hypothetical protein
MVIAQRQQTINCNSNQIKYHRDLTKKLRFQTASIQNSY